MHLIPRDWATTVCFRGALGSHGEALPHHRRDIDSRCIGDSNNLDADDFAEPVVLGRALCVNRRGDEGVNGGWRRRARRFLQSWLRLSTLLLRLASRAPLRFELLVLFRLSCCTPLARLAAPPLRLGMLALDVRLVVLDSVVLLRMVLLTLERLHLHSRILLSCEQLRELEARDGDFAVTLTLEP